MKNRFNVKDSRFKIQVEGKTTWKSLTDVFLSIRVWGNLTSFNEA